MVFSQVMGSAEGKKVLVTQVGGEEDVEAVSG